MSRLTTTPAKIVVTYESDGHEYELSADAFSVEVVHDRQFESFYEGDRVYPIQDSYELTAKMETYVIREKKLKPKRVIHRTARIEADDRTVEAYEQARERAGAPRRAKIRLTGFIRKDELIAVPGVNPMTVDVEFYWIEEV